MVGLDESGRGPLAGPVVAAALAVRPFPGRRVFKGKDFLKRYNLLGIRDSKRLPPKKREEFYKILRESPEIEWGIGRVSERVIERINILEATKLAMEKAVKNIEKKFLKKGYHHLSHGRRKEGVVDFLLIDGNFSINSDIPQKSIIKADEKVFSCLVAGIIAKVERDKIMLRYDKRYPEYGFARHKGYGTRLHQEMIKKYGPSEIHRKTFHLVSFPV